MWDNLERDVAEEFSIREGCFDRDNYLDAIQGSYYECAGTSLGRDPGYSSLEEKRNLGRRSRSKAARNAAGCKYVPATAVQRPETLDRYWARRALVGIAASYCIKAQDALEYAHFAVMRQLREERPDRGYRDLMEALEFETHKLRLEAEAEG